MQGILLSGGSGTRLWPITISTSKQLLPIYDKPLIYYPLSTLILSGVTDIALITSPDGLVPHQNLLGDGRQFGIKIKYLVQEKPTGLPDAFNVARSALDNSKPCTLILGDNFFYGTGLGQNIFSEIPTDSAVCFSYEVSEPENFGIVKLDKNNEVEALVEKPKTFVGNLAIPGLYRFPSNVFEFASKLRVSQRGETEIIDLLNSYLSDSKLIVREMPRGTAWLDTGTPSGMLQASQFVSILQDRQGLLVGSPDEVAWRKGLINDKQLRTNAEKYKASNYGKSLFQLLGGK